jgi:hypothetical protein
MEVFSLFENTPLHGVVAATFTASYNATIAAQCLAGILE